MFLMGLHVNWFGGPFGSITQICWIMDFIWKILKRKILHNYPFSGNTIFKTNQEGGWCQMKRNRMRRFFQQKQYAIASLVLFAAIAAMTGVYVSNRITSERQEQELSQKQKELADAALQDQQQSADFDGGMDQFVNPSKLPDTKEDVQSVTSIIKPEKKTQDSQTQTDDNAGTAADKGQGQQSNSQQQSNRQNDTAETAEEKKPADTLKQPEQQEKKKDQAVQAKAAVSLNFSPDSDLSWPLEGDVILNYSMDQTVYFATLDQYKYNPALIIAGKVNDPVNVAATGKITDISANEETGVTVTMDLGNGYQAVYGQLKEVLYKEGATVEAGNAIGYIAEPTKYYSVEGSNLYFELQKDNEPVNPMEFMQ